MSWTNIQLFPKWKQQLRMARITIRHSIISMPLSVSGIESILFVPLNSGSGVRLYSGRFAIRGYVLDHKRMENGAFLGVDYFEHLLAEIREIRLSERRFYQKLTDIYVTAIDYNKDAPTTRLFFKKVQNKMHYAVHGHTAAELIVERADANREHMGLTTWENAPNGKIVKTDVSVAKNYLREKELEEMGRIVNASLDMAESMAMRHIPMTMEDWAKRIDKFINLFESPILQDNGQVSAEYAKEFAESEF